jgi:hypothetical protein
VIASALAALAVAPWTHPLAFAHLPGWQTGSSGTTRSEYAGHNTTTTPLESAAWIARGIDYSDAATADPPNQTLRHLPAHAVMVWAVIFEPGGTGERTVRLSLSGAKDFPCCEAVGVPGGEWELTGAGPGHRYSLIVRIYFGSRPTPAMRDEAQRALNQLRLPATR